MALATSGDPSKRPGTRAWICRHVSLLPELKSCWAMRINPIVHPTSLLGGGIVYTIYLLL